MITVKQTNKQETPKRCIFQRKEKKKKELLHSRRESEFFIGLKLDSRHACAE